MQESQLFEYAVIRLVPRVEREEFINVGVVLFSKKKKFLKVLFHLDKARIEPFAGNHIDLEEVEQNLKAFERICQGGPGSGPIGQLDVPSRFRWLTATRSTVLQSSKVHPGFCAEPEEALKKLFDQLVR